MNLAIQSATSECDTKIITFLINKTFFFFYCKIYYFCINTYVWI